MTDAKRSTGPLPGAPAAAAPAGAPAAPSRGADSTNEPPERLPCSKASSQCTVSNNRALRGVVCWFEHPRHPGEAELRWLAGRQFGCVHRRQLQAAGFGRAWLRTRLKDRRIKALHSDVFLIGEPSAGTATMAALLHLRGDALAAGRFASTWWGMTDGNLPAAEVLLIGRCANPMPGVILHRAPDLDPKDIRNRRGLPITSPARTLIDLAGDPGISDLVLESAYARALKLGLLRPGELEAAIIRVPPRRPGLNRLRKLLDTPPHQLTFTRSTAERQFLALLRQANLPIPQVNQPVQGFECDFVFAAERLIVEIDGWEFHRDRDRWQSDAERGAKLAAAGWTVIRIPATRLTGDPYAVIAELTAALAVRGWLPARSAA